MHKLYIIFAFILPGLYNTTAFTQPKTDSLLLGILRANDNPVVRQVLQHPDTYRCQIIYTRIDRNQRNEPSFKNYFYNYDPNLYFNPASMVKMPLAFLALEKLNNMHVNGVDKYTTIQYDSSFAGQKAAYKDSSSANGLPSIAHYIKRAFLISENDPYNRLYQFVGQRDINRSLHNKGYPQARITRQFMGFSEEQNRHTNPVRFLSKDGGQLYLQSPAYNTDSFDFSHTARLGKGYLNRNDSLVNEPFDFTKHNNVPLQDFQRMLQSVLFPQSVPVRQRFTLSKDDREFLLRYLSQYPSETDYPRYDTSVFYDNYVKFFFSGSSHQMPSHIRVFNKVGWAYGFLTDVSYVIDIKNKVEYMLSATMYVNSDGILNDDKYDFDSIGHPFFYELGQSIYQYDLHRQRLHRPDLSAFILKYERRVNDGRPAIKLVDN